MLEYDTGGSTQNKNDNPPVSRRNPARAALTVALLGGLLAGCQTFSFTSHSTGDAGASSAAGSIPPRANAFVDGRPVVSGAHPAKLDAAVHLFGRPDIEFEVPREAREPDLLARLRNAFELPAAGDAATLREIESFAKHPDYMERVLLRADPYLYYIAEALEERGMPADLALLPFVESAFDPFAYSRGRASGLWQIIPGTATRLGLKQNWWFDGRRDVLESTRAALDYLEQMHEQFDGDWLLAVAAYNSGPGNVQRALKRAAAADRGSNFFSIRNDLPRETRTYVPRLLAIRALISEPEKYDLTLPALANEPHFEVVETGGQIDMALAAELAGLDSDRLYRLNAGVNRWATDPDGPHRLVVPIAHADRFAAAIAELGERERVRWTRYRIAPGDTLGQLAQKFATTPAVLREINQIRGNTIRAGDFLMIPHAHAPVASYAQSADARAERQQRRTQDGVRSVHVVKRGESLWSIARRYAVAIRSLASWNSMAPGDTLSVGRELVVWTGDPAVATVAAQTGTTNGIIAFAQDPVRRVNYVVRKGDSLSSIARRFRVTVGNLMQWNDGVSAQRYLQPGERLVMFVNVTEQST